MMLQKRAGDGIRTHDNDVGNVVLYQLSYTRLLSGTTGSWFRQTYHRPQVVLLFDRG